MKVTNLSPIVVAIHMYVKSGFGLSAKRRTLCNCYIHLTKFLIGHFLNSLFLT